MTEIPADNKRWPTLLIDSAFLSNECYRTDLYDQFKLYKFPNRAVVYVVLDGLCLDYDNPHPYTYRVTGCPEIIPDETELLLTLMYIAARPNL